MINALHAAGIEVILDVVYNHTAEGAKDGPCVSFRGLDAREYYWQDSGHLADFTGTGNTFDARSPYVVDLVMRSLRFWANTVGVDGFRFDLATTLARGEHGFDAQHPLLTAMRTDPVLAGIKLIAEPWDVGSFGWQTGNFPAGMSEWNDSYRDDIRGFWLSSTRELSENGAPQHPYIRDLATRFAGSADIFRRADPHDLPEGRSMRSPLASINFVTAHDGFTMRDLVSYNEKHNEANGEEGRDGESHNRSYNLGVEGPTDDENINAMRARQQRNFIATLMLSQGVPMLLHGDELGRTQYGNNNTYAQDSEVSWVNWEHADEPLIEFTRAVAKIRAEHPTFRRRRFFNGRVFERGEGEALPDILWLSTDGTPMQTEDWNAEFVKSMGMFLNGRAIRGRNDRGEAIVDKDFIIYFNASDSLVQATLPGEDVARTWETVIDTAGHSTDCDPVGAGSVLNLQPRSMAVLREYDEPDPGPDHSVAASVASMTQPVPIITPAQS